MKAGRRKPGTFPLGAALNAGHPLAQGLVGCWLLNEGGGVIIKDARGLSPDGVGTTLSWNGSRFGVVPSFNGLNSRIVVADCPAQNPGNQISISAWINLTAAAGANRHILVKPIGATWVAPYASYALRISTTSAIDFWINDFTNNLESTVALVSNSGWHHLAATYDGATQRIYVDGKLQVTRAYAAPIVSSTQPLMIGMEEPNGNQGWAGPIGPLLLYNRALSATEVQWLYIAPYAMLGNPRPGPLSLIA